MSGQTISTAYIEANGLAFEVDMCGEGEKLALLLHGFPESKYSWRAQLPVFAELGYTAWAPNLRGYGGTSRPKGVAAYHMDHLLDDVAGLIDAARARGVKGPVTLVAHDWGGAIAWTFVLKKLRPLERFIVMNLPHPTLMGKALRTWAQLKKSWYIFFFQIPWLPEKMMLLRNAQPIAKAFRGMAVDKSRFPDSVLDHYRQNAQLPGAMTAMINYYRANFRGTPPAEWTDPPMVDVPTLMIWGEEDSALGKELTYGTEDLVTDFTIRYLPQVSHWVQQEAPETVNAMIRAWIEGRHVPQAGLGGRLLLADS
ncbi:alpha/beta fold hydrolase [Parvibaculum sp.]|jgi:epoxide hydrolase 4|uniref:alpha/beta fold hydrolase n=1 Tax=Parvibaculum sp. TaxID=2024848 RepID=UPI000C514D37|nr:alpha/beta fold hydrolase [Parvibaculum sp.]MAM95645.1 epoxide hydrolase [Parvibaculum sp.]|tara:strand:+ start:4410 stop:5342 length:933 start_codon:yes stop_codon:yes gene_type:complete